jgi:hypothetical protein
MMKRSEFLILGFETTVFIAGAFLLVKIGMNMVFAGGVRDYDLLEVDGIYKSLYVGGAAMGIALSLIFYATTRFFYRTLSALGDKFVARRGIKQ